MMTKINLLPWREERRKQRGKNFQLMAAGSVAAGVLLAFLGWSYFNGQISGQQDRNAFLEGEIKKVEEKIKEIETLQQQKEALLTRKQVIEELQGNRFQMVHLFDALMRTVPDGLVLTGLKQEAEYLTLEGRAQSNARVATYMRNLESSGWMKNPDVTVIESAPAAANAGTPPGQAVALASVLPYQFTLRVTLSNPDEVDPNAAPTPDPIPIPAATGADPAAQMGNLSAAPGTGTPSSAAPAQPAAAPANQPHPDAAQPASQAVEKPGSEGAR